MYKLYWPVYKFCFATKISCKIPKLINSKFAICEKNVFEVIIQNGIDTGLKNV